MESKIKHFFEYLDYEILSQEDNSFKRPVKNEQGIFVAELNKPFAFYLPKSELCDMFQDGYGNNVINYVINLDSHSEIVQFLENFDTLCIVNASDNSKKWFGKDLNSEKLIKYYNTLYELSEDEKSLYLPIGVSTKNIEDIIKYNENPDIILSVKIVGIEFFQQTFRWQIKFNSIVDNIEESDDEDEVNFDNMVDTQNMDSINNVFEVRHLEEEPSGIFNYQEYNDNPQDSYNGEELQYQESPEYNGQHDDQEEQQIDHEYHQHHDEEDEDNHEYNQEHEEHQDQEEHQEHEKHQEHEEHQDHEEYQEQEYNENESDDYCNNEYQEYNEENIDTIDHNDENNREYIDVIENAEDNQLRENYDEDREYYEEDNRNDEEEYENNYEYREEEGDRHDNNSVEIENENNESEQEYVVNQQYRDEETNSQNRDEIQETEINDVDQESNNMNKSMINELAEEENNILEDHNKESINLSNDTIQEITSIISEKRLEAKKYTINASRARRALDTLSHKADEVNREIELYENKLKACQASN